MAEIWRHGFPVAGRTDALARETEGWGYDGLLLADSQSLVPEVWVSLAVAARATTTLRLGPGVTNPLTRHPSVTAAAAATLQAESGGRAVLGVGRGDSALRHVGERPAAPERLSVFVREVRDELAGGLRWFAETGLAPPPIDVAATGPRTIAIGAQLAERVTFTVGAEPERVRAAVVEAIGAAERAGRDLETLSLGAYVNVACHEDPAVARDLVRGSAAIFAHFFAESGDVVKGTPAADRALLERLGEVYDASRHGLSTAGQAAALTDDFIDRFAVVGPPEACARRLRELLACGLGRLVLVPGSRDSDPELLRLSDELLAREVLPRLPGA